ncbi:methyltransferase [Actinomadura barringtoniae]|uniref:Methyltransferase n=1 Tax=Actinomadura barringtoniae TaxID=1427535 RepID=A0A939PA83_9ACTN|nr:methyltransferase [Actinomadura barringtoniae]MBO2445564.1 methyltransferase [Actinomadura barringtoniae]
MTEHSTAGIAELRMLGDIMTPMTLRVAATLRIADLLAAGELPVDELAGKAGADAGALERLLRYLVARGIFTEPRPRVFGLSPAAALLADDHPSGSRRWLDLEGFGGRSDLALFGLLDTVRAGHPEEKSHKPDLDESVAASYDLVMEDQIRSRAPKIAAARDWGTSGHIVDLGGGTGVLLTTLLRTSPGLRGTLVEFPTTARRAGRVVEEAGVAERCDIVPGDLLQVPLPAADTYVMKGVLHGFDDDNVVRAFERCAAAGNEGFRVAVIERVGARSDELEMFTAMDLRMLILGEGRERTLESYAELAAKAGLVLDEVHPPCPDRSILVFMTETAS